MTPCSPSATVKGDSSTVVRRLTCGIWISCLMWMGFAGQLAVEEEEEMGAEGWLAPYSPPACPGASRPCWLSCLCLNTCKGCGHWESWEKKWRFNFYVSHGVCPPPCAVRRAKRADRQQVSLLTGNMYETNTKKVYGQIFIPLIWLCVDVYIYNC